MPRLIYLVVPLLPAAALLAPVPAATAMEPTTDSVSLVTHPRVPCPDGGVVYGTFNVDRNITTFYDQSGNAIREEWWDLASGSWTNPLTGATLDSRSLRVFQRDLLSGEVISTGTNAVTKLPDGGVAIGGAGRQVFDAAGHLVEHDGPDSVTERAQLCDALSA